MIHDTIDTDSIHLPIMTTAEDEKVIEITSQLSGISLKKKTKPKLDDIIDNRFMDYSKKKCEELIAICKEQQIKGYSGKRKHELIELIQQKDTPSNSTHSFEDETDIQDAIISNDDADILSANSWKNTKTFKTIKDKETQIKYYKRMNSCEEVLQLVDLESKPFGSESEKIIQEIFKLSPRTSTQNDGTRNGKKIEIKSARYWAGKDDCVWQHLEPDHDYEYAMFALLDFQGWKIWAMKKSLLMGEMREKNIVTFQGKQGWWVRKSAILPYLTPIKNIAELDEFIRS
jgi:hypothetical protein